MVPVRLCTELLGAREIGWTVCSREEQERLEADGAAIIFEGFLPGRERRAAEKPKEEARNAPPDADGSGEQA